VACGCRGKVATNGGQPGSITGFRYTFGGVATVYMTIIEARAKQRSNGGGTIKTLRAA
jgi:hypothetical protein